MKSYRKFQYACIALGFISTLGSFLIDLYHGKTNILAISCTVWVVYVFLLERQADRTDRRIKQLNDEIQDMIGNIGKLEKRY